jgi:squalene-hopene/tetraprenyl-beta-curcumene cyclase
VRAAPVAQRLRRLGIAWLLAAQNRDGGWGGAAQAPASIEETALALSTLAPNGTEGAAEPQVRHAIERGTRWLVEATGEGLRTPAAQIGLYFARLWYYEELYPLVFALRGLSKVRACLADV